MKKVIIYVVFWLIVAIAIFAGIWYATSAEVWYSDQHDSHCEKMLKGSDTCHCTQRLIEAEKKEKERK